MRRAYNELKSIVVTPVAPMHPCTYMLHISCCRHARHNLGVRRQGDRSIDDNRWRRTKNGGDIGGMEKQDVITEEPWSDREVEGWWRGGVENQREMFPLSPPPRFDEDEEEGQRWKLGGETTRLTLVEPRSNSCGPRLKSSHLRTCIESARVRCRSKGIG